MKKCKNVLLIILCPIFLFSQNVEMEGGLYVDSIDVNSGRIMNVINPLSSKDAATKNYVDNLVQTLGNSLSQFSIPLGRLGVQALLNDGYTVPEIMNYGVLESDFIGLNHAGGIIFHVAPDGTGLVAASADQSTDTEWGCPDVDISTTVSDLGSGSQNTLNIIGAACNTLSSAASLCSNLSLNGHDDWFLPSLDELEEMYINIGQGAGGSNDNIGDFLNVYYWSSSELNSAYSLSLNFNPYQNNNHNKNDLLAVRAARAF